MVTLKVNKIFLYFFIFSLLSCKNYNKCVRKVTSNDLFLIEAKNVKNISVIYKNNMIKQKLFLERLDSKSNLFKLFSDTEININQTDTVFINIANNNYIITNFRFTEVESIGNPCLFEYEINGLNTSQKIINIDPL